ncbi:hypothetical protein EDB87DRAFT_1415204 [Lactarius vividus]|nr:hypothetical protein EDB87DRAFT_1415204 [Lactarius vividus]
MCLALTTGLSNMILLDEVCDCTALPTVFSTGTLTVFYHSIHPQSVDSPNGHSTQSWSLRLRLSILQHLYCLCRLHVDARRRWPHFMRLDYADGFPTRDSHGMPYALQASNRVSAPSLSLCPRLTQTG